MIASKNDKKSVKSVYREAVVGLSSFVAWPAMWPQICPVE
jgi:hypothetical protein